METTSITPTSAPGEVDHALPTPNYSSQTPAPQVIWGDYFWTGWQLSGAGKSV